MHFKKITDDFETMKEVVKHFVMKRRSNCFSRSEKKIVKKER